MEQMMEQLDCLLENNKSKPGREYSNSTQKKKILKVKNSLFLFLRIKRLRNKN